MIRRYFSHKLNFSLGITLFRSMMYRHVGRRFFLKMFHFSHLLLSDSEMASNRGFGELRRSVTRAGWKYDGISMRNELLALRNALYGKLIYILPFHCFASPIRSYENILKIFSLPLSLSFLYFFLTILVFRPIFFLTASPFFPTYYNKINLSELISRNLTIHLSILSATFCIKNMLQYYSRASNKSEQTKFVISIERVKKNSRYTGYTVNKYSREFSPEL